MRLSQSDVVPVLTIIAGGAIGLSLSAGILMPNLLLESRSDVVPCARLPWACNNVSQPPTSLASCAGMSNVPWSRVPADFPPG